MNSYCVYIHKNKTNKKCYVGITNDINKRWRNKGIAYKPYKGNKKPLWNAICKYGWDNFDHIILESNLSKEQAELREQYYIFIWQTQDRDKGYNVADGGNGGRIYVKHPKGMKGKHHSEETKQHLSETNSGSNNGFYGKSWDDYGGHPKGFSGHHHNEKTRKTMTLKAIECIKKSVIVIYPDGTEVRAESLTQASKLTGISVGIIRKLLNSGEPYKLSKNVTNNKEQLKSIVGLRVVHQDNTEITK